MTSGLVGEREEGGGRERRGADEGDCSCLMFLDLTLTHRDRKRKKMRGGG